MNHKSPLKQKIDDILAKFNNAASKSAPDGLITKIGQELLNGGDASLLPEIVPILSDLFIGSKLDLPLQANSAGDFKPEFATSAKEILEKLLTSAGKPGLAVASRAAIDILKKRAEDCGADRNATKIAGLPVKPNGHGEDVILYFVDVDQEGNALLPKVDGSEMIAFGILQRGFLGWAKRLNLVVNMVTKQEEANLLVTGATMGSNTSILARTEIGPPHGRQLRMVFNLSKTFTSDMFESHVMHEFGHTLGIFHEDVKQDGTQVMDGTLHGVKVPQGPGPKTDLQAAIFNGWKMPS